MAVDGSDPVRSHAVRIQQLLADYRARGVLPPANFKGAKSGLTPAQRSAAGMGVGDNLRDAVTDTHTEGLPVASSWVDQISTDIVNGDGSIDPSLAFAEVELYGTNETLSDPEGTAAEVASLILHDGSLALLAHGADVNDDGSAPR